MSSDKLPQSVSVKRLADNGARLAGKLAASRLNRVAEAVLQLDQGFDVQMDFDVNEHNKSSIAVKINGAVNMQCQRCLAPVTVQLEIATHLVVVAHDDEARSRIREWEPIVLEDGLLDIDAVVEEEILLSLPLVAMHPLATTVTTVTTVTTEQENALCETNGVYRVNGDTDSANVASIESVTGSATAHIERRSDLGMTNPFDVLKTLKTEDGQ